MGIDLLGGGTVKPGPDVDLEGIEVARECLAQVFKLDPSSIDGRLDPGDELVSIFSSIESREQQQQETPLDESTVSKDDDAPPPPPPSSSSFSQRVVSDKPCDSNLPATARSKVISQFL